MRECGVWRTIAFVINFVLGQKCRQKEFLCLYVRGLKPTAHMYMLLSTSYKFALTVEGILCGLSVKWAFTLKHKLQTCAKRWSFFAVFA